MKKTISIALSVIMILCMVPFAAFASDNHQFVTDGVFEKSDQLVSGDTYSIEAGATMTVPSDLTLYIPTGTTLLVKEGGKLVVLGNIITIEGGTLRVEGSIANAKKVGGAGDNIAVIRFPSLADECLNGKVEVSYAISEHGGAYEDMDKENPLTYTPVNPGGAEIEAKLNQYLFIKANIIEDEINEKTGKHYNKYDNSLMNVYLNGVGIPFKPAGFDDDNQDLGAHSMLVGTAGNITYSNWINDEAFYSTFKIYLPTGPGYTVYGREGEQSATGQTVRLKFGQPFSFKVEIDPEYDMSSYEVYIYNGYGFTNLDTETLLQDIEPAKPDEYGYYHMDAVKGDTTIYVVGVVENETILLIGDIFDMIRNFFEMIMEFFKGLIDLFQ